MIEIFGRFLLGAVCSYAVIIYYEKVEVPRRLEAAKERLIFLCEDLTPAADCKNLTPVLMKCE